MSTIELLEMPLAEQLRAAIAETGISANQLAKVVRVSQPTISRFLSGGDIRISVAERLAEHLKLQPIADQLRVAIAKSGLSANQLAKEANVSQTTVSRFIAEGNIRMSVAERLAVRLNLELLPIAKPKRHNRTA
jgi:predicted transcriptional regulator